MMKCRLLKKLQLSCQILACDHLLRWYIKHVNTHFNSRGEMHKNHFTSLLTDRLTLLMSNHLRKDMDSFLLYHIPMCQILLIYFSLVNLVISHSTGFLINSWRKNELFLRGNIHKTTTRNGWNFLLMLGKKINHTF